MNLSALAARTYSAPELPVRTERDTEYALFARITGHMRRAAERGRDGFPELVAALNDNLRLWTMLASDVADPDNALPAPLRAQLFYLADFTMRHTGQVLARKAGAEALIDINTALMRGLVNAAGAMPGQGDGAT